MAEVSLGITLFNDIVLDNNSIDNTKILGKILLSDVNYLYQDYYLKIVTYLFTRTGWYDLFKINISETLRLEYSHFIHLKQIVDEFEINKKRESDKYINELDKEEKEIAKIKKKKLQ